MKLPIWGSVFTVCGIAVLCTLGVWQVQRAEWKGQILKQLDAVYAVDAGQNPLILDDLGVHVTKESPYVFKRGFVSGKFLNEKTLLISPKVFGGKVGAHVVTPFEIENGRQIILVNRGWVPQENEAEKSAEIPDVTGIVKVTGLVRPQPEKNAFTPANDPLKGVWYFLDVPEIAAAAGLAAMFPNILIAEEIAGVREIYPLADGSRIEISNNHAGYAVFWFSMAGVLACVYILRFILPQRKK